MSQPAYIRATVERRRWVTSKNTTERDWLSGAGVCFWLYLDFAVPRRAQSILQMSKIGCGSARGKCSSGRVVIWRMETLTASGWEPNICSGVILNRLSASSAGDGGANLGGVNQNHLSALAGWLGGQPTHPTAMIRGQMFAFISVTFVQSFEVLSAPMPAKSAQKRQRGRNGKCIGRSWSQCYVIKTPPIPTWSAQGDHYRRDEQWNTSRDAHPHMGTLP